MPLVKNMVFVTYARVMKHDFIVKYRSTNKQREREREVSVRWNTSLIGWPILRGKQKMNVRALAGRLR